MSHYLVTRRGMVRYRSQQGIGFSCVLFAWIVAASAIMSEFCPVPGFDDFCFKT